MWLWHGTYEMYYKQIKYEKCIRPVLDNTSSITKALNKSIKDIIGKDIRSNCVYLANDIAVMEGFDYSFRISTKDLDTSKLMVADNNVLDYMIWCKGTKELRELILKYMESYIPFSKYEKVRKEYDRKYNPEFLYYGSIQL